MVRFIENELSALRDEIVQMWNLVYSQLQHAKMAVINLDGKAAQQIAVRERRVDAFDLKIDSDVEDYIALYNPVAVDLRFILAMLKINSDLERIGDYADGIARFVSDTDAERIDAKLLKDLQLEAMFGIVFDMMEGLLHAFVTENVEEALAALAKDDMLDKINRASTDILVEHARRNVEDVALCLALGGVVRKLERTGDHMTNIAEEIIFCVDAKVMKHADKKRARVQEEEPEV